MNCKVAASAAILLATTAGQASAQSAMSQIYAPSSENNLRVYGILDLPVESLSKSDGSRASRMLAVGALPSRLGFMGTENLGEGLQAGFRLESGLNLNSGNIQGGRFFARESSLNLLSQTWGELRIGRQISLMQIAMGKFDIDHMSMYSPTLAAQQSNLEQTSQDNVIGYRTPQFGAVSAMLNLALGGDAAVSTTSPQVPAAGTARNSTSALVQYDGKALQVGLGYLTAGQTLTTGGHAQQTMLSLGGIYKLNAFEFGALAWQHRNALPNGRTPTTNVWSAGVTWTTNSNLKLIFQVGGARDNGLTYATGATKARGTDSYINLGGDYALSNRTSLYGRFGRISDTNGGYNGRPSLAAVTARDVSPLLPNQSVRGISLGIRHVF